MTGDAARRDVSGYWLRMTGVAITIAVVVALLFATFGGDPRWGRGSGDRWSTPP